MSACEERVETPDGVVYVCARSSKHKGRHRDKDGVEWSSACTHRSTSQRGAPWCRLTSGHKPPHRSARLVWWS